MVREKGIDAFTAKALAGELGVSTQPVFTCFHTIEEAKHEVCIAAKRVCDSYMKDGLRMKEVVYNNDLKVCLYLAGVSPYFFRKDLVK